MAARDKQPTTWGVRRRWRGKMVNPPNRPSKGGHGGTRSGAGKKRSIADAGFECGQNQCYPSRSIPAQFKRQMPKGYIRYIEQRKT